MRASRCLLILSVVALAGFAARGAPQSKSGAKSTKSKRAKAKKPSPAKKASSYRRSAQQQPTLDRFKEIQQALAGRGYFRGAVDGKWGPDSVESLKRFQHDQNLVEDGKLGSLSLIALGLGPRRGAGPQGVKE